MPIRMFATPTAAAFSNGVGVLVPPAPFPAQRAYATTVGTPIDVPGDMTGDAEQLANQGFAVIAQSGTTALRPNSPKPGTPYVDTSLNAFIFWDGANWRNAVTGASV